MTRKERMKAFEMRLDGKNWVEIGKELGYSHATVYGDLRICILAQKKPVPCIYPAIARVIADHYDSSINAFAERCEVTYGSMYSLLSGRTTPRSLGPIVCAVTGLSYEDAFRLNEER